MGPGSLFTACLGHLLLLHLEGSQVHWQGNAVGPLLATVLSCSVTACLLYIVPGQDYFPHELVELYKSTKTVLCDFINTVSCCWSHNRVMLIWFFFCGLSTRTIQCCVNTEGSTVQISFFSWPWEAAEAGREQIPYLLFSRTEIKWFHTSWLRKHLHSLFCPKPVKGSEMVCVKCWIWVLVSREKHLVSLSCCESTQRCELQHYFLKQRSVYDSRLLARVSSWAVTEQLVSELTRKKTKLRNFRPL